MLSLLLPPGSPELEEALEYLGFWLKSIYLHTYQKGAACPPVVLVGTHAGDLPVDLPSATATINELLVECFEGFPLWNFVEANKQLCFFPVDNRQPGPLLEVRTWSRSSLNSKRETGVACGPMSQQLPLLPPSGAEAPAGRLGPQPAAHQAAYPVRLAGGAR